MTLTRRTPLPRASKPMRSKGKSRSKSMRLHMCRVAAVGCIACLIDGNPDTPAELHHPRSNAGAGQKSPDSDVIPLCHAHHRGTMHPVVPSIHLDRLKFIATFGTEAELLERLRTQMARKGAA